MALRLIDRFQPRLRREQQAAIDTGWLSKVDEVELLGLEQLHPLAVLSLYMLLISTLGFGILNLAAYYWQQHGLDFAFTFASIALWLIANIVSYIVVLPVHEAIHALVIAALGGTPYFGAKLPLALYCGAENQLFRRDQYLLIALAPLVVLTLAAIVCTLLSPIATSYVFFATVGNFSGAAGDVWSVRHLLRLPPTVLVEDTRTGYRVWEIAAVEPDGGEC